MGSAQLLVQFDLAVKNKKSSLANPHCRNANPELRQHLPGFVSELAISATEIRRWKKRTESVQRTLAFSRPAFDGSFRVCFSNLKRGTVWPTHVRVERWGAVWPLRFPNPWLKTLK